MITRHSSMVNVPELVGSLRLLPPTIEVDAITQMHNFRFTLTSPGAVFVKLERSGVERKIIC